MEAAKDSAQQAANTVSNAMSGSNDRTDKSATARQEPESGHQGAGTAAKPFDYGNAGGRFSVMLFNPFLPLVVSYMHFNLSLVQKNRLRLHEMRLEDRSLFPV